MGWRACRRTRKVQARRCSCRSCWKGSASKPGSPSRSRDSRAREPRRSSNSRRTGSSPAVRTSGSAEAATTSTPAMSTSCRSSRRSCARPFRRVAKLELAQEIRVHASPPWNYRNRTRLRLRTRPFVLGYNRLGSSELLAIEQCPISSPLINRAIAALWELGRADNVSAEVREIEFFANADDTRLLAELTVQEAGWRHGRKSDLAQFVHRAARGGSGDSGRRRVPRGGTR